MMSRDFQLAAYQRQISDIDLEHEADAIRMRENNWPDAQCERLEYNWRRARWPLIMAMRSA